MGVMVDDYERIWCLKGNEPPEFKRGKGGAGGSTFKGHPMQERDFGPFGHDYERSNGDKTDIDEAKMGEINDKIKARLEAKLARDFDTADGIKAELLDMGIELHDGKKQWRADGEDFNQYVKSGSFKIENEEMVKQLIGERSQAKRERDYDTADSIKARLVDEFNVMVDDRRMTYRVADNNSAWAKSEFSDELEADQEAGIKMLIEQRAKVSESEWGTFYYYYYYYYYYKRRLTTPPPLNPNPNPGKNRPRLQKGRPPCRGTHGPVQGHRR